MTKMYAVISFDFGGDSDVQVHSCTTSVEDARDMYARVTDKCAAYNARADQEGGYKRLVDLVEFADGFQSVEGQTLYWGRDRPGARTLVSNNRDPLPDDQDRRQASKPMGAVVELRQAPA